MNTAAATMRTRRIGTRCANEALAKLREGRLRGAAVLLA
jgi:hypothetical protein